MGGSGECVAEPALQRCVVVDGGAARQSYMLRTTSAEVRTACVAANRSRLRIVTGTASASWLTCQAASITS